MIVQAGASTVSARDILAMADTVTAQVAVKPPSVVVTVIVAVPSATGVTTPFTTVATVSSLLLHVRLLSSL